MEFPSKTQLVQQGSLVDGFSRKFQNGEFILHYQPQVHLPSRKVTGYEGLIRWSNKARVIPPSEFLNELEQSGLIEQIWPEILDHGVRHLALTQQAGMGISIALNATPNQVTNPLFANDLSDTLKRYNCHPSLFEIEITERSPIFDHDALSEGVLRLKEIGITVILDDFGAGYANLRQVAQLPVDGIKIDKYFTQRLSHKVEREITKSVIELANLKEITVLAEGIEYKDQENELIKLGCTKAQGFLYGHPTPMICLENHIRKTKPNALTG